MKTEVNTEIGPNLVTSDLIHESRRYARLKIAVLNSAGANNGPQTRSGCIISL